MDKKRITIFALIAAILMCVCSFVYYHNRQNIILTLTMLTPAISVILTRIITHEGTDELFIKPHLKGNIRFYISSYLLTPVVAYVGAVLYFILFRSDFAYASSYGAISAEVSNASGYTSFLLTTIPLAVLINPVMGLLTCAGEEFAWRGYILPKLNHFISLRKAVIIDGIIWGIWHAPIVAMGFNYGEGHPIANIFAMILLCIVLGIISSYLFMKTKSIWCSVLFHAAVNGMDLYAPSELFMSHKSNVFIGPDLIGIVGGVGFIILAIILFVKLKHLKTE